MISPFSLFRQFKTDVVYPVYFYLLSVKQKLILGDLLGWRSLFTDDR